MDCCLLCSSNNLDTSLSQHLIHYKYLLKVSASSLYALTSLQTITLPGASVRNPAVAKVMRKEARHMQRHDLASAVPPGFSWTSTPKTRVCLPYCTVLSTLLTFSGKKLTQGFSLLHMKGMFQLKPLWWLSNLPDNFPPNFYNLWIVYSPPTTRGTKLKAS